MRCLTIKAFRASPTNFACMTFNLSTKRPEAYFKNEMNEENAQNIILASASCYPAFPVMKMNDQEYIDGGYWDNDAGRSGREDGREKGTWRRCRRAQASCFRFLHRSISF